MGELLRSASVSEHDLKRYWDWTQPLRPLETSLMRCNTVQKRFTDAQKTAMTLQMKRGGRLGLERCKAPCDSEHQQ